MWNEISAINFLKRLFKKIGDDCAYYPDGTLITTDAFLEEVHFSLKYFSFSDVAKKTFYATISDIIAMGGEPKELFIAFFYPPYLKEKDFKKIYYTYKKLTKKYLMTIAGGDIIKSDKLAMVLTCLGKSKKVIKRSTAKVGDKVYVTGYLGLAETGRLALVNRLDKKKFKLAIKRHLEPEPRTTVIKKIKNKINALIDTSDGLATDANHLSKESKVKIILFFEKLPIADETYLLCEKLNLDIVDFVLQSGEDFELLFTSNKRISQEINNVKISEIGEIEKGKYVYLLKEKKLKKILPVGYQHIITDR